MLEPVTVTPPRWEPVSVPELRKHLRIDHTEADDLLLMYLRAAREQAELFTGRAFATQDLVVFLDGFESSLGRPGAWRFAGYAPGVAGGISLPRLPVQAVTAVSYTDSAGVPHTVDPSVYRLTAGEPAIVRPVGVGVDWPTVPLGRVQPVSVAFTAGYPNRDSVPETVRQWIRLQAAAWFENPEAFAPGAAVQLIPRTEWCLTPWRVSYA